MKSLPFAKVRELDNILHDISGLATVLIRLGETENADIAEVCNYAGARLMDHWRACIAIIEDDEEEPKPRGTVVPIASAKEDEQ